MAEQETSGGVCSQAVSQKAQPTPRVSAAALPKFKGDSCWTRREKSTANLSPLDYSPTEEPAHHHCCPNTLPLSNLTQASPHLKTKIYNYKCTYLESVIICSYLERIFALEEEVFFQN